MAAETKNNPFSNIFQFYLDQAEKLTPVLKQGIDDWFTVYNKVWIESMQLQGKLIQQLTGNTESIKFNEQAKNFGERIIDIQKEFSSSVMDVSLSGIKSIIEAAKKSKL
jgi:hypothetical protein